MQISTDNSPPQGGVGGGLTLSPRREWVRSSFALPSLYLRLDIIEIAKAQWSYSEGISKRLPTKKIFGSVPI